MRRQLLFNSLLFSGLLLTSRTMQAQTPAGFTSLFDGKSFHGWVVPEGDNGHWKIVDGVIDYDASSESPKDKTCGPPRNMAISISWSNGVSRRRPT